MVTDRTDKHPSGDASLFDVSFINDVGSDEEREQNTVVQTDGKFDESKVYWNSESILLSYPNRIISRDIFYQSQNSRFANSFAPAYISRYPHAYFVAPFCLEAINAHNSIQRKPLLIYSPYLLIKLPVATSLQITSRPCPNTLPGKTSIVASSIFALT